MVCFDLGFVFMQLRKVYSNDSNTKIKSLTFKGTEKQGTGALQARSPRGILGYTPSRKGWEVAGPLGRELVSSSPGSPGFCFTLECVSPSTQMP